MSEDDADVDSSMHKALHFGIGCVKAAMISGRLKHAYTGWSTDMPRARHEGVATLHLATRSVAFLAFLTRALPNYRWLSDLRTLVEQGCEDILEDPVSQRIEKLFPKQTPRVLTTHYAHMSVGGPLAGPARRAALASTRCGSGVEEPEEMREAYQAWDSRTDRVMALTLEDLRSHQSFEEMTRDLARGLVTLARGEDFADGVRAHVQELFTQEHAPTVKALADAMLDCAFESATLDTTRANVTAFLEAFFRESDVAFFGKFVAAFCEDALRTNKPKKARAGAQRLLETLMSPKTEQTATDIVGHAVSSLMRVYDDDEVAEILEAAMRRFMDAVLTLAGEQAISAEVDMLTVQEAAGYLGLRPMSFHSHIRSHAKTPAEVPVKMLKKGRGRGTYAIALEDLQTWEDDHWNKISRSSRRRRRRMSEEAQ